MSNLPEKMKAIVAYAPGDYRFEMVDTPRAGEGEMILKVEACGICAGDTKAYAGAASFCIRFRITCADTTCFYF